MQSEMDSLLRWFYEARHEIFYHAHACDYRNDVAACASCGRCEYLNTKAKKLKEEILFWESLGDQNGDEFHK